MSRFAAPTADPHGLRDAARRLARSAAELDGRGVAVAAAGTATLSGWSGSASLQFVARARSLRTSTAQAQDALEAVSRAAARLADEVEQARQEVARLNDGWGDAVERARRQAEDAAEQARRDTADALARGEQALRRGYDDGSEELREQSSRLQARYEQVTGDLRDAGFSLERALRERDPVALLPGWVAGGIHTGQYAATAHGLLRTRGAAAARYADLVVQASRFYDLGRPAVVTALLSSAQAEKLRDVLTGRGTTGRFAVARTAAGRAFLPLTFLGGISDAATGGGHDGARGALTRVAGAAGAAGALALGATYLGLAALGPVGVAIAAGAVIGYGLWSLGNLVYDHRAQIGAFFGKVGSGLATGARHVGEAVTRTVDSARQALSDGAAAAVDTGRRVVDVLTSPARLLPSLGGLF